MLNKLTFNEKKHEYYLENWGVIPSVTQILEETGFINTKWYNDFACLRGSYTHEAIHLHNQGILNPDSIDDEIKRYFDAYLDFIGITGAKVIHCEKMVLNRNLMYAGTLDLILKLNDNFVLIDNKTGGVQDWVELQLNGYADALEKMKEIKPRKLFSLQLKSNGSFSLKEWRRSNIFKSIMDIWNWKYRRIK